MTCWWLVMVIVPTKDGCKSTELEQKRKPTYEDDNFYFWFTCLSLKFIFIRSRELCNLMNFLFYHNMNSFWNSDKTVTLMSNISEATGNSDITNNWINWKCLEHIS
jgi:hypothetical protein